MEGTAPKKKRRRKKRSPAAEMEAGTADPFVPVEPTESEPAAPEPGEWDENAANVEAAIIPPPPGAGCCGEHVRVEYLDADGQPTGTFRTFGYQTAVAQVRARRARYVN